MGIQINCGFRFRTNDFIQVHENLMRWRRQLLRCQEEKIARFLANHAVNLIDRRALRQGSATDADAAKAEEFPLSHAYQELIRRQDAMEKTKRRDPEVDFDFNVVILPFEGRLYGMLYTEQPDWRRLWLAQEDIEEFGYSSSVDAPDGISDAEWEERSRVWHALVNSERFSAPAMLGFEARCTLTVSYAPQEVIVQHIPSLEERVAHQAKRSVFNARASSYQEGRSVFGACENARQWLETTDGQKSLASEADRLRRLLQPTIGIQDLLGFEPATEQDEAASPEM